MKEMAGRAHKQPLSQSLSRTKVVLRFDLCLLSRTFAEKNNRI